LAISRLLISKKPIWLLDEPISSLDREGVSLLKDIIDEHISHGGMAIISSHIDFLKKCNFQIDMDK
jgi:heme exporter protein A